MNLVSGFQETESKVRYEIYGFCAMQRASSLQVKCKYLGAGRTVKWGKLKGGGHVAETGDKRRGNKTRTWL